MQKLDRSQEHDSKQQRQKRNGHRAVGCDEISLWVSQESSFNNQVQVTGVMKGTGNVKIRASKEELHSKVWLQKCSPVPWLGVCIGQEEAQASKWKSEFKKQNCSFMCLLFSHLYPLLSKGPWWRQMLPKRTITKTGPLKESVRLTWVWHLQNNERSLWSSVKQKRHLSTLVATKKNRIAAED